MLAWFGFAGAQVCAFQKRSDVFSSVTTLDALLVSRRTKVQTPGDHRRRYSDGAQVILAIDATHLSQWADLKNGKWWFNDRPELDVEGNWEPVTEMATRGRVYKVLESCDHKLAPFMTTSTGVSLLCGFLTIAFPSLHGIRATGRAPLPRQELGRRTPASASRT